MLSWVWVAVAFGRHPLPSLYFYFFGRIRGTGLLAGVGDRDLHIFAMGSLVDAHQA